MTRVRTQVVILNISMHKVPNVPHLEIAKSCHIGLARNLGPGLSDLLGGLKSTCGNDGGTYVEDLLKRDIQDRATAAKCFHEIAAKTVLTVAGVNAAIATCIKLPGQLNDPNSDASHYVAYIKKQSTNCASNDCTVLCRLDLTTDLGTGLCDLLGELKSTCENDNGTYVEKLLLNAGKRDSVKVSSGGCAHSIPVYTILWIAGVKAAFADCKNLSGQLDEPDSNVGRYAAYVKEQSAICHSNACLGVCRIDLINNLETGLEDLLGELKSTCQSDNGTYSEKLLLRRDIQDRPRCTHTISATTLVSVARVDVASVVCRKLGGELYDPDSEAGNYVKYVKLQNATCETNVCQAYCSLALTSNLKTGLDDLLGGLKSVCETNGGTYDETLL